MIKPIVRDQKILKVPCKPVLPGEDISGIIKDLEDTFATLQGFGLAANQIGYDKAVSIVRIGEKKYDLINPKIIQKVHPFIFRGEKCFSFMPLSFNTDRWGAIVVEHGVEDDRKSFAAQGLEAVVVQHEVDHLKGILILQRKHKAK